MRDRKAWQKYPRDLFHGAALRHWHWLTHAWQAVYGAGVKLVLCIFVSSHIFLASYLFGGPSHLCNSIILQNYSFGNEYLFLFHNNKNRGTKRCALFSESKQTSWLTHASVIIYYTLSMYIYFVNVSRCCWLNSLMHFSSILFMFFCGWVTAFLSYFPISHGVTRY